MILKFRQFKLFIIYACLISGTGLIGTAQIEPKNNIDSLLNAAIQSLESGDYVNTETNLKKILVSQPRNITAQTLAGIVAERQNKLVEAEKHFALAAKIAPQSSETRNNYGAILVRLNRRTEAAREFAASLKVNPSQLSATVNLAQIRLAENNFGVARELFVKAKTIAPDAEILKALVLISLQLNEKERAVEEYKEYAVSRTAAVTDTLLSELLLNKNLLVEARQELEFILDKDADNIAAMVLLARVFVRQKNIPSAGKLLESAVARGISDAKIYLALAEVYQAAGYPENAIPAMRLAIEKEPTNENYRIRYGLLLIDSKAPAAAAIRIEEAIKEFPKSARLRLLLGMTYFNVSDYEKAVSTLQQTLSLEPRLIPALGYLAATYIEQGKYNEAVKIYEQTLKYDEKNALLHYLFADTLLRMQNSSPEQTESELKRAVALDPDLALAHSALGRIYVRQSRWEEACVALERAVALDSKMSDALYQLGLVYARLKRTAESKTTLAKVKELNASQAKQRENDYRKIVRKLANTNF